MQNFLQYKWILDDKKQMHHNILNPLTLKFFFGETNFQNSSQFLICDRFAFRNPSENISEH